MFGIQRILYISVTYFIVEINAYVLISSKDIFLTLAQCQCNYFVAKKRKLRIHFLKDILCVIIS